MKNGIFSTFGILTVLLIMGCGPGKNGGVIRSAVDTPAQFQTPAGMEWGDNSCKNPIIDPLDGTELILVQSDSDGMGDYRVTGRKYGVNRGELLRVNCRTGVVVGIVRGGNTFLD